MASRYLYHKLLLDCKVCEYPWEESAFGNYKTASQINIQEVLLEGTVKLPNLSNFQSI